MLSSRTLVSEFLGTAFLLATVVGTGALAHKLDNGNIAVAVMAVAFATGAVLYALIMSLGGISSHFNPVVTVVSACRKEIGWSAVIPYIAAQIAGGCFGVIVTNLMFELPPVVISQQARTGAGQWLGEFIATFGLLGIILGTAKYRSSSVPAAVGAYVAGAIWFTSSTCFANPAVTIARVLTDTLTGIRPSDVPAFIAAQIAGAVVANSLFGWLYAGVSNESVPTNARDSLERTFAQE